MQEKDTPFSATAIQALARRALGSRSRHVRHLCNESPARWSCGSKRHWTGGVLRGECCDKEQQLEVLPTSSEEAKPKFQKSPP